MSETIISSAPKSAALYYDDVVPTGIMRDIVGDIDPIRFFEGVNLLQAESPAEKFKLILDSYNISPIFNDLLPDNLSGDHDLVLKSSLSIDVLAVGSLLKNLYEGDVAKYAEETSPVLNEKFFNKQEKFNAFAKGEFEYLLNKLSGKYIFDFNIDGDVDERVSKLILSSANLVDVSSVGWDQIIEFRRDKNSRLSLLRFRKFFYENLSVHSRSFIQEELERLKLEYDEAARKHGFELTRQSITSILSTRAIAGGGLMGFVASQAGLGPASMIAAAAPIVAEFGVFAFHLYGHKHSRSELQASHPISYLTKLEDELLTK